MNTSAYNTLLLFDGDCGLCNNFVKFVEKRNANHRFHLASLQSSMGKLWLMNAGFPSNYNESVVYIKNNRYLIKSTACLTILRDLGGWWKLWYAFIIIPKAIRDRVYNAIAANRFKTCSLSEQKE